MSTEAKKKAAFIIKDFNDAGTERNYFAGTIEQIDEGEFINYEACGLVRAPTAEDRAATKTEQAKA